MIPFLFIPDSSVSQINANEVQEDLYSITHYHSKYKNIIDSKNCVNYSIAANLLENIEFSSEIHTTWQDKYKSENTILKPVYKKEFKVRAKIKTVQKFSPKANFDEN